MPAQIETCFFCEKSLDYKDNTLAEYITGWVERRAGGGVHGVRLKSKPMHLCHQWCLDREVERVKKGIIKGQEKLF